MNETLPIRWIGYPVYPSDPPEDFDRDPVHLVLVQGPGRHPGPPLLALWARARGEAEAPDAGAVRAALGERARARIRARSSSARSRAARRARRSWSRPAASRAGWCGATRRAGSRSTRWRSSSPRSRPRSRAGVPVADGRFASSPPGGRFGTARATRWGSSPGRRWRHGSCVATSSPPRASGCRASSAAALARIHSRRPRRPSRAVASGRRDPALEACELWEAELDTIGEPLPGVEAGLRWLRLNAPPPAEPRAGPRRLPARQPDRRRARTGGGDRLGALPRRRPGRGLGWLCIRSWRFGNDELPVAGLGELDEFLDAYEAAGGGAPRPRALALVGGDGERQVGGDLRPPGPRPPDRRAAQSTSSRRSDGGSASPNGTCWSWSAGLMQDRPMPPGAARRDGRLSCSPRCASGCRASAASRSWCSRTSAPCSPASCAPGPNRRWPTCACSASSCTGRLAARAGA